MRLLVPLQPGLCSGTGDQTPAPEGTFLPAARGAQIPKPDPRHVLPLKQAAAFGKQREGIRLEGGGFWRILGQPDVGRAWGPGHQSCLEGDLGRVFAHPSRPTPTLSDGGHSGGGYFCVAEVGRTPSEWGIYACAAGIPLSDVTWYLQSPRMLELEGNTRTSGRESVLSSMDE